MKTKSPALVATPRHAALGSLLVAALLGIGAVEPALAGSRGQPAAPQSVVRYGDLDLDSDAGARELYRRIVAAARRVCPTTHATDLRQAQAARACREGAIARAVQAIGSERLAAIRAARGARVS